MTAQESLLPCPFCGGDAHITTVGKEVKLSANHIEDDGIKCLLHGMTWTASKSSESVELLTWSWNCRQPVARTPLSDEQIDSIGSKVHRFLESNEGEWGHVFARAIEAAHGITQEKRG